MFETGQERGHWTLRAMTTLGWLESIGVGVFAVSGVLSAARKQLDLFGAVSVAFVCALGGGTVRDLLLGLTPVTWIRNPLSASIVLCSAFVAFFVLRVVALPNRLLLVLDALGLGLFSALGTEKALHAGTSLFIAALMGTVSGSAGGVIRDILCGDMPLVLRSELYATAALLGAVCFGLLLEMKLDREVALWSGAMLCFALRLAAIKWRLRLPLTKAKGAPTE